MLQQKKVQGGSKNSCFRPPLSKISNSGKNDDFSQILQRTHRALGMSDFDARRTVGKEIVHSFHFLTPQGQQKYVHTSGTQKAQRYFFQKSYQIAVPGVCLMCAYNVPDVCTYFWVRTILKYGIRAFQRTLARLCTTKTRCCSSI